jgi:hypothetical protein
MKIISIPGKRISKSKLKDLYQLRLSILPLKSTISESEDYLYFYNYAQTSQQVFIFQNKEKQIKGFYFCKYRKIKLPSKTFIRLEPEYGIMDKSYRGRGYQSVPIIKVLLYLSLRYPLCPIYFAGTTYPSSYISIRKQMPTVIDSTESLNPVDKSVFMSYVNSIGCTPHKNSFIYENPTIPELSEEIIARYEKSPYYLRFQELNPDWRDGKSLAFVSLVNKKELAKRFIKTVFQPNNRSTILKKEYQTKSIQPKERLK